MLSSLVISALMSRSSICEVEFLGGEMLSSPLP